MLRSILAILLVTLLALQAGAATSPSLVVAESKHIDTRDSDDLSSFVIKESPLDLSDPEQHTNCAVQRTSHGFSKGVVTLLHRLQPYLGEDRVARYNEHVQSAMGHSYKDYACDEKVDESSGISIMSIESESTEVTVERVDLDKAPKRLILALGILASVLGVAGLLACLKRRCWSLRYRVERLADREERMKAREYRIAARQESRRRFWSKFRRAFTSCFTGGSTEGDEEKAVLVLNAAEEGRSETLEEAQAHVRGICYVRDVATQLAATGHFGDIGLDSTPASQAHLQQQLQCIFHRIVPQSARSRASSLPSYDSEILPDYSSQPDMDEVLKSALVVDGFRRPLPRNHSGDRFTPVSSIPTISPRPSFETLSTQESGM